MTGGHSEFVLISPLPLIVCTGGYLGSFSLAPASEVLVSTLSIVARLGLGNRRRTKQGRLSGGHVGVDLLWNKRYKFVVFKKKLVSLDVFINIWSALLVR
jgi:hypothetical protein